MASDTKQHGGIRVVYCRYDQDEPVVKLERRSSKIGLFGTPHSVLKPTGTVALAHDHAYSLAFVASDPVVSACICRLSVSADALVGCTVAIVWPV